MRSSIVRRDTAAVGIALFVALSIGLTLTSVVWAQGTPALPRPAAAAPAPAAVPAPSRPAVPAAPAIAGTVNINTATAEELALLPGVGPTRAKAILAYRQAQGPFKRLEDLANVKGIGDGNLKRLRPFCTLDGKTTARPTGS